MRKKLIVSLLIMTAVTIAFSLNEAQAGFPVPPGLPAPPGVNVSVTGFLPAPPGVHVMIDSGRPYYVERDRRVYMEREHPAKHHKKNKKHHDNRGHDNGRGHGHD